MNPQAASKSGSAPLGLIKPDPTSPCLFVTGRDAISIRAGTTFYGITYEADMRLPMPAAGLEPGTDYAVIALDENGTLGIIKMNASGIAPGMLGGFHFAPGGNAPARAGGDSIPAINPNSIWDLKRRPTSPDPRGMELETTSFGKCWADIYLLGKNHRTDGTSRFGVTIADGDDPPQNPAGGYFNRFDYPTALAVYKHHGKTLFAVAELFELAYGVTEKTSLDRDPKITGLDAPRTSRGGLMGITGSMWQWCHDGDPDTKRPGVVGGSWLDGGLAGSRYAFVGHWPESSRGPLGARGRSDHLELE